MQSGARLSRSDAKAPTRVAGGVPGIVQDVLRSPGQPLTPAVRAAVEPRFGHDFSRVRVHIGDRAAESARAVDALAYTVGRQVVFGHGDDPARNAGSRLLAHELAHVVQHDRTGSLSLHRQAADGGEDDAVERDADAIADDADVIAAKGDGAKKTKASKPNRLTFADVKSKVAANNNSTVSTELLICLIWKESGFVPTEKNARSSATGLMQMTTAAVTDVNHNTPKGVHFEPSEMTDPDKNIACGTYYLQMRIDRSGSKDAGLDAFGTGSGYSKNILTCETCLTGAKVDETTPCLEAIHT